MEIFREFVLILLCGFLVVGISSFFKIPNVIGFILTGFLLGPGILGWIPSTHNIEIMSEIGVMLLMFTIGLEFSPKKLVQLKNEVFGMGGMQVLLTILMTLFFLLFLAEFSLQTSLIIGCVISMSSTAIVLKHLKEMNKIQTPYGKTMTGVLLFQDLCVVPFLMLIPMLGQNITNPVPIMKKFFMVFIALFILFVIARYFFPQFFKLLYRINFQELFLILVLAICFGIAMAASSLGFSLSMGSFIAGVLLSETDFIMQIQSEIHSLKNLFLSFFFISVGLLVDLFHIRDHFFSCLQTLFSILVIKTLIISMLAVAFRHPLNIALCIGLGLSQIGEFSFIILNESFGHQLISSFQYQNLLSASVFSMMATPGFLYLGNRVLNRRELKKNIPTAKGTLQGHVIIAGYGITGQNISRILKNFNIPYVIIEMNPHTVRKFKATGEPIYFGDITNLNNMKQLGIAEATIMTMALSDWDASILAVKTARKINPELKIIVRTEYVRQIEPLYEAGATLVVSQEFESSLEMAYHLLKIIGIPDFLAHYNARQLKRKHYAFFIEDFPEGNPVQLSRLKDYSFMIDILLVPSHALNLTIEDLLFQKFECSVMSVIRNNEILKNPERNTLLQPFDLIIIYGPSHRLEDATENAQKLFRKDS